MNNPNSSRTVFYFSCLFVLFSTACQSSRRLDTSNQSIRYYASNFGNVPWDIWGSASVKGPVIANVFNHPLGVDSGGRIQPELIKSWEWNEKETGYHFEVDQSYTYPDGTPVSPQDIEFLLIKVYISSRDDDTPFAAQQQLKGIEKLKKGMSFRSGMCECVRVLSQTEFVVRLKRKNSKFLHDLADLYFPISPVHQFDPSDMYTYKGLPMGTGRYLIKSYDHKKSLLVLELRQGYRDVEQYPNAPKRIELFNKGEPQAIKPHLSGRKSAVEWSESAKGHFGPIPHTVQMINFNFDHPLSKSKLFREAISLGIARDGLVDKSKKQAPHPFLKLDPQQGFDESPRKTNRVLARQMVRKSFREVSSPQKPLRGIFYSGSAQKPEAYKKLEKQLSDIGLYVNFEPHKFADFSEKDREEIALLSFGKVLPYFDDLYAFFPYSSHDKGELPNHNTKDSRYKSWYQKAIGATSKKERRKWAQKLSELHRKNFTQIPLYIRYPVFFSTPGIDLEIDNLEGKIKFHKVRM